MGDCCGARALREAKGREVGIITRCGGGSVLEVDSCIRLTSLADCGGAQPP